MTSTHPSEMSARAAAGREVYARNFGVAPAEAERIMRDHAGAAYTREALEAAGGPGWHGRNLTDRDRGIAVITALVAQNVTDGRLSTYLALARRTGLDDEALTELMILLTAYLGQPYTSLAMEAVRRSAESRA
ncbi:carboxymuconolactone decarboxylase family protein [Jidongwangia harbinensis]|uniref:carboxymuconolactone decarboxylase family protein n=1 Tax=Jidongwangia harbinensis TaxID=2878561 RepID=UPI001CDA2E27|nr:carboxymuconolactone decarboxylase family protein [Jidongwangia harbinensis]MCA2211661.1 carboxymuconolactone decarboxylase family protein [Jidongwangia harbinensis]